MNERILELFKQAANRDFPTCVSSIHPNELERFTELIIAECVDVALAQKKWVEEQKVFSTSDLDWNKARIQQSQRIADKINEHFGVE